MADFDTLNTIISLTNVVLTTGKFITDHGGSFRVLVSKYLLGQGEEDRANPGHAQALLEDLGSRSNIEIRNAVQQGFQPEQGPNAAAQREEFVGVLTQLSNNARFLTTQGLPKGSYVRSERLVEQLLDDLDVKLQKGAVVGTGWRLERFLGRGSFGEVWLGTKPGVPHQHAFKFFTQERGKELIRQEQEALYQIAKKVHGHPGIIQFLDFELDVPADAFPYLMLEYADQGSLEDWILCDHADRPTLQLHEILRQVASALASAHQHGIAHGDLKPANVLLTGKKRSVQAKIVDFGLSKTALHSTHTSTTSSQFQHPLLGGGTWMYLPPEAQQRHQERSPRQDDVFAFGVLWYQLIIEALERPPYDFAENLRSHGADSHTISVISRCLADPKRRFKDAHELHEHMHDIVPQAWAPPKGLLDVQDLFREYLSTHAV